MFANGVIIINEFQVLPTQKVELMNISQQEIDIGGYYIDDSGGTTYYTIPQNTLLLPYQCIVFQSNFNLNTTSPDMVRLFDSTLPPTQLGSIVVDSFSYNSAPTENFSYARDPDGNGNFALSSSTLSSYNSSGINCVDATMTITPSQAPTTEIVPTPTITPTTTPSVTPTPIAYKNNVYLSEILPNPSSGSEWIEIYNANSQQISLVDWSIDDFEDTGASPQKFSIVIDPYGYVSVDISGSMFNNDSDIVRLIDDNNNEIGAYMYNNSTPGISWATTENVSEQIFCLQVPSKEKPNTACIEATKTQTPTPTKSPTPTKTPTFTPTPTQTPANYTGVYISEFLARTDETNPDEWIEIYNDNRFSVTLKNWSVGDSTNPQAQNFTIDIDPYRFAVIELSSSRLNNTTDTVYLSDNLDKVVDSYTYPETQLTTSWGRKPGEFDTWCKQTPSKNNFNTSCINPPTTTPTKTMTPTKSPTPTKTPALKIPNLDSETNTISQNKNSVLGAATSNTNKSVHVAYTPRSNYKKTTPFSFSVNAESIEISEEDVESENINYSLLSIFYKDSILTRLTIVLCILIAGYALYDLYRLWEREKVGEFDD